MRADYCTWECHPRLCRGWVQGYPFRSSGHQTPFIGRSTKCLLHRTLRSSVYFEKRRVGLETQDLGWKTNQSWLCCSSGDQSASDPQGPHCRTEPTPPATHPQPFPWVSRPPHLHQNSGEWQSHARGCDWCKSRLSSTWLSDWSPEVCW